MDKLDIWIYIILFVVIPVANALLGSKKKKQAKNVRPVSPQPKKKEGGWDGGGEKWQGVF